MVSVIIPAYNNPAEVEALLASISSRCSQANSFEVIVVDDGSVDEALRHICARHPFVRFLKLPGNQGAAAARNAGVREASYDLLFFLDSDMIVLTDVIDLALQIFQDPSIDAVVGSVSTESMNPGWFKKFWALMKAFSLPKGRYSSTFYPMVGAIRKRVLQGIGGFNEQIKGASIEDYEFSMRLEAAGYRVHYNPALLVGTHYKDILTSLSQSFSRSAKWVLLFWRRKQFDNHTTTGTQAVSALCGACLVSSSLLTLAGISPLMLTAGFLGLYLYFSGRFLLYIGISVGIWFVPIAVFFHLILSLVVTCGAVRGAAQLLLGPKRSQALLYR